jgi:hypothetical protein
MNNELFVCDCGDVEHQFIITYFDDADLDDQLCIQMHLSNIGFWNRIKYAFCYIIGNRSKYGGGAFGEVLLDKKNTAKLITSLQNYHKRMN